MTGRSPQSGRPFSRLSLVSSRIRNDSPLTVDFAFTITFRTEPIDDSSCRLGRARLWGGNHEPSCSDMRNAGRGRYRRLPRFAVGDGPAADLQPATAAAPSLFGTLTLPVKAVRYYDDWERARRDDSNDPACGH